MTPSEPATEFTCLVKKKPFCARLTHKFAILSRPWICSTLYAVTTQAVLITAGCRLWKHGCARMLPHLWKSTSICWPTDLIRLWFLMRKRLKGNLWLTSTLTTNSVRKINYLRYFFSSFLLLLLFVCYIRRGSYRCSLFCFSADKHSTTTAKHSELWVS